MRNKTVLWVYLCTSGKQKHTKSKTEQPQLKCSLNLYMLGLYLILGLQLNKIDRILLSEDPPNSGKKHDIHIIKINKHCCVKVGDTGTELMGSEKWEWRGEKDFPEAETQISRLIKADTDGAMFISCGSISVEYYLWMIKKKKKTLLRAGASLPEPWLAIEHVFYFCLCWPVQFLCDWHNQRGLWAGSYQNRAFG